MKEFYVDSFTNFKSFEVDENPNNDSNALSEKVPNRNTQYDFMKPKQSIQNNGILELMVHKFDQVSSYRHKY